MTSTERGRKELMQFLNAHPTAGLATVSKDNKAHASTVYYFADPDLFFYFVTKSHTIKHKNLKNNTSVALCISDDAKITSVQVEGEVTSINEPMELSRIVDKFKIMHYGNHNIDNPPISKLYGDFVFYKVIPRWLRWVDFNSKWTETSILELNFS